MPNNQHLQTVGDETNTHHHHHHHHHSSSGEHRTSGHHHRYHKSSRHSGSSGLSLKERILRALPSGRISSRGKLSKIANSQRNQKRSRYAVISSRVLFCTIVVGIVATVIYYINLSDEDPTQQMASYTPSETSQLKTQVTQLQNEVERLTAELEKYKALYGELKEEQ